MYSELMHSLKYFLLISWYWVTICPATAQKQNADHLKSGDLLFQDLDCGPMCDAIEAVTTGWNNMSFSHIGIVESSNGVVYVWESMGPGVRRVPLESFCKRTSHAVILGRLKKRYERLIPAALRFIRENEGVAYDDEFLYNNGKYYCSELIFDAFKKANTGRAFFKMLPMTFRKPGSSAYFDVWEDYFKKLGTAIPEGKPGCNPGWLSRSKKIVMIGPL